MALKMRSLPLWRGRWKWGAMVGDAVTTSSSSSVKYAGSIEESRS
jgi:hypothetical protein